MKRSLFAAALVAALSSGAVAEDALVDEDAFFGEEATVESEAVEVKTEYQETFIKEEPVRLGGSFDFTAKTGISYARDWADWNPDYFWAAEAKNPLKEPGADKKENSGLDLSGSLFFLARPSADLRFYGKAKFELPFALDATTLDAYNALLGYVTLASPVPPAEQTSGVKIPNIKIWELYSDFDVSDAVFFRAGKQMVKWGTGIFWSPADIVSLTPIDVNDREAEREGPLALKANVPIGEHNLDLYAIAPSDGNLSSVTDLGVAGRFQAVLGGWELSLGAGYQKDRDWQFVSTASGSLWKFGLFGEALVNRRANGTYFLADSANPTGYKIVTKREDWFFSGTAGASYSNSDLFFSARGQYYFNGMGYEDIGSVVKGVVKNLEVGNISERDLMGMIGMNTGKHYIALLLTETFSSTSKVSVSAYGIANLNDFSGFAKPTVSIKITDEISLSGDASVTWGSDNTQYRGFAKAFSESGNTMISSGSDKFRFPRFSMGLTLTMGSGRF